MANKLNQIIDFPTWANNILDLVLCKDGFNSTNASVISPLIYTDHEHLKVTFKYITNLNNTTIISKQKNYCFPEADFNSINNYLSNINWRLLFSDCKDVVNLWTKFINKLKEGIDLHVPCKKQVAVKYKNKPVPNFIRKLMNKMRMLWSKLKKNPNKNFKSKNNYAARAIKFAIKQYNDKKRLKLAQQKNLKLFYSYINNKPGRNINSKIKTIILIKIF